MPEEASTSQPDARKPGGRADELVVAALRREERKAEAASEHGGDPDLGEARDSPELGCRKRRDWSQGQPREDRQLFEVRMERLDAQDPLRYDDARRPDDAGPVLEPPDHSEVELGEEVSKLDLGLARERDHWKPAPSQPFDRPARLRPQDASVIEEGPVEVGENGGESHGVSTRAGASVRV